MKVISDTSPLIALSKIERLFLLEKLFGKVIIPQTVYDEFLKNCDSAEQQHFLSACQKFIEVIGVSVVRLFSRRLDKGEQEVLILAIQEKADIVILDDRKAYNEAREHHLVVASTRAILRIAEKKLYFRCSGIGRGIKSQKFFPS